MKMAKNGPATPCANTQSATCVKNRRNGTSRRGTLKYSCCSATHRANSRPARASGIPPSGMGWTGGGARRGGSRRKHAPASQRFTRRDCGDSRSESATSDRRSGRRSGRWWTRSRRGEVTMRTYITHPRLATWVLALACVGAAAVGASAQRGGGAAPGGQAGGGRGNAAGPRPYAEVITAP